MTKKIINASSIKFKEVFNSSLSKIVDAPKNICPLIEMVGTVPNLKGDPKYSERGPKGDLILSKKGT